MTLQRVNRLTYFGLGDVTALPRAVAAAPRHREMSQPHEMARYSVRYLPISRDAVIAS
ncbi:MAG TPA: hypothetical protein VJ650_08570 [Gemmatimonadaceae bacterium]|nr:hypothetical protein [Gemmatimonadaceae bacterium]